MIGCFGDDHIHQQSTHTCPPIAKDIISITITTMITIIFREEESATISFIDENGDGVNSESSSDDNASPSSEQQIVITINQVIFIVNMMLTIAMMKTTKTIAMMKKKMIILILKKNMKIISIDVKDDYGNHAERRAQLNRCQ